MATAFTEPKRSQQAGTDVALVARARLGDGDAINELIRAYSPRLRCVAWRVVRNWADAEDVVQSALWKACQHLPDYQERAAFSTWLTRIAINEGVGLLRKRRTEPANLAESDAPLQEVQWPTTQTQTPEQILGSNEIQQTVRQCMACIRDDYRAVLWFAIWDELSHEEIAERLGLSIAAVKTRLHRARRVLQRMLRRQGAGWPWSMTTGCSAPEHIGSAMHIAPIQQVSGN
jgi:RNA polymerase sigma-70 factor (ECF subfamily)